jgi:hypothetical protein
VQFCDCDWDRDARPWQVCEHYERRSRWRIDDIVERFGQRFNPAPELGKEFLDRYRSRNRRDAEAAANDPKPCTDRRKPKADVGAK